MFLLEQVVNGLVLGGYYLLIALGLSLIFSVGGVVNLAHGAFYAIGAYVAVTLTQYLGFPHYGDEYKVMGLASYGRPEQLAQ